MNRLRVLLAVSAFSLLILALPGIASAQWRDDNYGRNRNGGYGNGGYGNGGYNGNMRSVLNRLKDNSRDFARRVDRELDNSRYNGRNREDRINDIAKSFRDATNRLDDNFDNNGRRNNGYNDLQRALSLGNQLDNALRNARLSYGLQGQWNSIQRDLDMVANYYGYNNNRGRSNRNNGGWNNGGWRNSLPFPLPF